MTNPYLDLAHKLRHVSREEARAASPPPRRALVTKTNPLSVEDIGGDLALEDGDDDVEVSQSVRDYDSRIGIDVGDQIIIDQTEDGDYLLRSVISDKSTA